MIQTIVNGILLGGMYTAIALGLSLVFGVMRLVNLAHGELLMVGAYLVFFLTSTLGFGIDPFLALIVVAPVIAVGAYLIQRVLLTPLLRFGLEPPLVGAFGLSLLLQALLTQAFTGDPRSLDASYSTAGFELAGIDFRVVYLIAFAAGIGMALGTQMFVRKTEIGRALRASASDAETAETMGINVGHVYGIAFALGAVMAAVGGVLIGVSFSFTPTSGTSYLVKGFAVVVIGGLGSIGGTVAGGLIVGLAETIGAELFGGVYADLVVFLLLILILALKPNGLFGRGVPA